MDFDGVLGNVSKDKFRATANKLLNECFLLKQSQDTKADYSFALNNRDLFSSFFELLGYELKMNEREGVIALNNQFGTGRIHLRKIDSIILLILRLLYIEKRRELSEARETIIIVDEIYDKYGMLRIAGKIDKLTMRSAMALFKRYHLIDNLDKDMSDPDTRIKLWPSLLFSVTTESLDAVYKQAKARLAEYAAGNLSGDNGDDNADEENSYENQAD